MGVDAMKIGVEMRKFTAFSIRSCHRSVCNHPFLVGFVCFLIFLYRSSPLIFSLLVSASPVLVCTAILLGTLLSFGKPNIPEIEKEEKVTSHEIASLKTGVVGDATVVERDENENSSTVERCVEKRRDIVENALDESILVENRVHEVEADCGSVDCMPLSDEHSREIQCEKQVIEQVGREFNDFESDKKREVHEENPRLEGKLNNVGGNVVDDLYSGDGNKNYEVKDARSPGELIYTLKEDQMDSVPGMSWKRFGEDDYVNDGGDVEGSVDSGSDGAESSSPDASMADIIPMLDELHPLLDLEAPQPVHISNDGSEADSGISHKSEEESVDSGVDSGNEGEEGEGEDGNDDDEEEEEEAAKGDIEDESKSAIKWTEVDQRNLMDLGTSELERNQRLENLIARRRARKNSRLMTENNLIDLESTDLPFNVPPIATTRQNPFELPYDVYDNMAIPGSAPSILLPRQNPFDLPYDSSEEKPDLKGDGFQEEFTAAQTKEPLPVYRRNETFSVGPSLLGGPKQERQDFRWKPYFVPERLSSEEGTSYSTFQRQLSEVSESKLSSVPDTESLSSAIDEEDKQFYAEVPEQFSSEGTSYTAFQRQMSENSESKLSSVPDTESVSSTVDEEDKKLNNQDLSQETKVIPTMDRDTEHVEFGIQSSEGVEAVEIEQAENRDVRRDEVEITLGDVENDHEKLSSVSGTEGMTTPEELNTNESFSGAEGVFAQMLNTNESSLKTEPGEEECSSRSSLSSLSEVDEKISDTRGGLMNLAPKANHVEASGVSTRTSIEESEFRLMSGVLEHKEPLFDLSPQRLEKFLSFSSISSDKQEITEIGSPPLLLGSADKSELQREEIEKGTSGFKGVHTSFTQAQVADESQSTLGKVSFGGNSENDLKKVGSPGVDPNLDDETECTVNLFPSDMGPSEYTVYRGEHFHPKKDHVVSSSHESEILVRVYEDVDEKLDSAAPGCRITYADSSLSAPEGQQPSMVDEHIIRHSSVSSLETEPVNQNTKDTEEPLQLELDELHLSSSLDRKSVEEGMKDKDRHLSQETDQVHPSSFDADIHVDGHHDAYEDLDSVPLSLQHIASNDLMLPKPGEQQPPLATEQVAKVHRSSEADCVQNYSLGKEETRQLEEDQVQLCSASKINLGLNQDMESMAISTKHSHEDVPSEKVSASELEKQLSWSDKSPSYDDIEEPQEALDIQMESAKEINIVSNANVSGGHELEEKTLKNSSSLNSNSSSTPFESPESGSPGGEEVIILNNANVSKVPDHEDKTLKTLSSLTSNSSSTPFRSPDDKSPTGEDVKAEILEKVVYGDHDHVKEHFNDSIEAYGPHIDEESINEEADEIKEIDQGLLFELDAVGDFSVKEVSELLHSELTPEETNISNNESVPNNSIPTGTNLELPVLEAKSIQDIVLAFKQLDEGVDVEEVIVPSMLEDQVLVGGPLNPVGTSLELPVLEARSLEDIHTVLKQVSESNLVELLDPMESKVQPAELEENEIVSVKGAESSQTFEFVTQGKSVTGVEDSKNESGATSNSSLSISKETESSSTVESVTQDRSVLGAGELKNESEETCKISSLSDGNKECIATGNQTLTPILTETPVILNENENPDRT